VPSEDALYHEARHGDMRPEVAHALRQALYLVLLLAAPPALAAMAVGAVSAALQTATQVRERSLSSVPKVVAALLAFALAGPWIGTQAQAFLRAMLEAVPALGRP
jgi:flagellar biosynthesis protein FliQ